MDQAGAEVDTMSKPEGTAGPRALGTRLCVFNSFLLLPYEEIIQKTILSEYEEGRWGS